MPHRLLASSLTVITTSALSVTAWFSAHTALVCWVAVVLAANLLWIRSRATSRSLTLACVVSPVLWVLPPLFVLGAVAALPALRRLRSSVLQHRSVTTHTSV